MNCQHSAKDLFSLSFCFSLLFFITGPSIFHAQKKGLILNSEKSKQGYVLFAPLFSKTTFLINKNGEKVHSWTSRYNPGQSVYLLPDGKLLRTGNDSSKYFPGSGGVIELLDWSSKVVWNYRISDSIQCQHHDVCPMPNGNILVLVWVKKTKEEALSSGRDPDKLGKYIWSEKIMELRPVGKDSAVVVWQWEIWDHLVQDRLPQLKNYGEINKNPGLLNINYKAYVTEDWLHFNSLHYSAELDQVLISNRNLNEIYIIDHSTTIAEASTHKGGKCDRGGDLLYRWGNPAAYNSGTAAEQKLFRQHHAQWIANGLPFAGNIIYFNNGPERPEGEFSTVEIIQPPLITNNTYTLQEGSAYLPVQPSWIYKDNPDTSFFSINVSSAQMLSNGNVIICEGANGRFFEINAEKKIVWSYINPIEGEKATGPNPQKNQVFRCIFYEKDYPGFKRRKLKSKGSL